MAKQTRNLLHIFRNRLVYLLSLSLLSIAFAINGISVSALAGPLGITVSPIRTELEIAPGTAQSKTLSITNNTSNKISITLSAEEFNVVNQDYDYAFNIESQLTKWVTFTPAVINLDPGKTENASFTIGVPVSAEPGGRYICLFATTDAGDVSNGEASRQRVASLVYLNVAGDVTRSGQLVRLMSPWLMTGITDWGAQLQNTGTTHFRSRYSVTIKSLIGDNTIVTKSGDALILPGNIRALNNSLPLPGLPGIYKVTYTIGLGDTPAVVETRTIVYLPPVAIIVPIFALILILSLISEYRRRKRR